MSNIESTEALCYRAGNMVRLKVREIAEQRGITNPFALSRATGINYANTYKLWHSEQRMISMETINRLCIALKVKPGQLFEYKPEE